MSIAEKAYIIEQEKNHKAALVAHMVSIFLKTELPNTFKPDGGIKFTVPATTKPWPTGTNLFTAEEATTLFTFLLNGAPTLDTKNPSHEHTHVQNLIEKASLAFNADVAMKFSQAAVNAANAMCALKVAKG